MFYPQMQLLKKIGIEKSTNVTKFILIGFRNPQELQFLLFSLFLLIYMITLAGNILIVVLVIKEKHLHTPMYFFLGNFSCIETCYSSTVLPKALISLQTGDRSISFQLCFIQHYFFASLGAVECYLLSVMSYDRYLAICHPLHYANKMNGKFCVQLVGSSFLSGFLAISTTIALLSNLDFCGPNEINHFFCDVFPLIELSCSDTHLLKILIYLISFLFTVPPFLLTVISYGCIITAVLKITSSSSRQKAFSTCSSHLIVVTLFYGTITIVYILPNTDTLRNLNKVFSVFYAVLTPMINPLVYSLRNNEVKKALRKHVYQLFINLLSLSTKLCSSMPLGIVYPQYDN
ncbi:olfactory receptor 2AP1-like [Protobothrops mucrosquamatus]|uniref:olfactory receptor 2AP1-like n=1 Tax=Protobothrops mucrosquamatus TaxID=103944 RepID=UPI000775BC92|nr:olfactory receptor 2AP1-like [Protobothrops mucrosquamatus]